MISIEVGFATTAQQKIIKLAINENCSIIEAIKLSQIQLHFPDYDLYNLPVGVFGKRIYEPQAYQLKDGDRLEIYRQLNSTPNQKRLERAKNQ